jgi:hypothetical protein
VAIVKVRGSVVDKRRFDASDGREAQFLVNIQDHASSQRFGSFVPVDHPLVDVVKGQVVECTGDLRVNRSGGYFNLNLVDVVGVKRYDLVEVD